MSAHPRQLIRPFPTRHNQTVIIDYPVMAKVNFSPAARSAAKVSVALMGLELKKLVAKRSDGFFEAH